MNKKPNLKKMSKIFDEIQINAGVAEKPKKKLHWFTKFLIFVDFCAVFCFFMAYGPISGPREWLITTALGTGNHRYFAYVLYSENFVKDVASKNTFTQAGDKSDVDAITFVDYSNVTVYKNEYEKEILEHDENAAYKVIRISDGVYSGYMAVIYQPERLDLVVAHSKYGNEVSEMVSYNGGILGVNGGGYYVDLDTYVKYPMDNIITKGKTYYNKGSAGNIIGMNKEGVLMLYKGTTQEAINAGMYWGVEFGPFLIVNGQSASFTGDGGGGGRQPRTAIGQRKDGIVLLVVIDGRGGGGSQGATFVDLLHLFEKYECYNAANLDGGGSSVMYEKGKLLNHPVSYQGAGERNVLDAIIFK